MNQNTVTGDYININLRQLGATSIKEFNSIMHIAEFDLGDGLIVSYVFNITRHNKYFLQRMQPYAMVHGKFASDQEIIDFITADLKRFENKTEHRYIVITNSCACSCNVNSNITTTDYNNITFKWEFVCASSLF